MAHNLGLRLEKVFRVSSQVCPISHQDAPEGLQFLQIAEAPGTHLGSHPL